METVPRQAEDTHPSTPPRSSPVPASGPDGASPWGSPRRPWPVPESEASARDRCRTDCDTARRRALGAGHEKTTGWEVKRTET